MVAVREDLVVSRWPHRLAVVTAGATLLLIFVGGVVTNTGSALAVPDWPTTFGYNMFLYPWSRMVGGVFYEHSHRLIGSAVGLLTVTFALWLWATEPRKWVRVLGLVAVAAVIVQGVLGGLRVVLLEHGLAIIHGCVAEAFLALMVGLAVFTSQWWLTVAPDAEVCDDQRLGTLGRLAAPLVYLQIVCGALVTHTGTRLDVHVVGAALATLVISLLAGRVLLSYPARADLRRPAVLLIVLLALQLCLGVGAYLWRFTTLSTAMTPALGLVLQTTHRLVGASILATSAVLGLRVVRLAGGVPVPGAARVVPTEHRRQVLA